MIRHLRLLQHSASDDTFFRSGECRDYAIRLDTHSFNKNKKYRNSFHFLVLLTLKKIFFHTRIKSNKDYEIRLKKSMQ